jgi:hypothetical protein
MCLQGTHFLHRLKELKVIVTKSKQMQVRKFPIVTSYCLLFGFWLDKILYIHPYPKRGTSNGAFIVTLENQLTSHRL